MRTLHILALTLTAALAFGSAEAAKITGADGVTVDVNSPKRVVAMGGATAEIIYALGKGGTVIGHDWAGTYPPAVEKTADVGHWAKAGAEGIISLKPDLVIATEENFIHGNDALKTQLRGAGVPLLVLPNAGKNGTRGFRTRVNMIADVYGAQNEARDLLKNFVQDLGEARRMRSHKTPKVMFLYAHGPNDSTIYGTQNGADTLIRLAGGRNVATAATNQKLTAEAMVKMNPDVIIMLNRGFDAVGGMEGLMKMPGVAQTTAGKNRAVYTTDNSIRWVGPRLPEFAKKLASEWKADLR